MNPSTRAEYPSNSLAHIQNVELPVPWSDYSQPERKAVFAREPWDVKRRGMEKSPHAAERLDESLDMLGTSKGSQKDSQDPPYTSILEERHRQC